MSEEENTTISESIATDLPITKTKIKGMPSTNEEGIVASSSTNRKGGKKQGALVPNQDGIISSGKADLSKKKKPEPKPQKEAKTVAIHSTRNVTLSGVGKVQKGYNIVSQEAADAWLERSHIRLATPEEVAGEYGN